MSCWTPDVLASVASASANTNKSHFCDVQFSSVMLDVQSVQSYPEYTPCTTDFSTGDPDSSISNCGWSASTSVQGFLAMVSKSDRIRPGDSVTACCRTGGRSGPRAASSAVGSSAAAAVSSKAGNDGLGFSADEVRIDHALTCLVSQLPQPDSVVTRVLHLVSPTLPES